MDFADVQSVPPPNTLFLATYSSARLARYQPTKLLSCARMTDGALKCPCKSRGNSLTTQARKGRYVRVRREGTYLCQRLVGKGQGPPALRLHCAYLLLIALELGVY